MKVEAGTVVEVEPVVAGVTVAATEVEVAMAVEVEIDSGAFGVYNDRT